MNQLVLDRVGKTYGRKTVLDEISHGFPVGLTLLTGPSGAGKSTLLRLLATSEKPSRGSISWDGVALPAGRRALRQSLGYAPQAVDLPDDLTAREFALHIASLKGLDQAAADKQFGRITGLLYRPHIARRQWRITAAFARWFSAGPTPAVIADAPAARRAGLPLVGLVVAEFRLIGAGKLFLALAALVAAFGMIGEYRHAGSPAAMLLLIFGMTAHAGRSEARKLLTLSNVAPLGPMLRRIAFLVAGLGWTLLLAAPAAVAHLSPAPLLLAAETGAATSLVAIILAAFSGSAFAPRLVLIVGWYFYLST